MKYHHAVGLLLVAGLVPGAPCRAQEVAETSEGGDAGVTFARSFSGEMVSTLTHRDEARLEVGSGTAQSARVGLDLEWAFDNPRGSLRATLAPYYEQFSEASLSAYGGVAGLSWNRQVNVRRSWSIRGTASATPEQDIPAPQLDDDAGAPAFRVLVPRNGFVAASIGAGLVETLSPKSNLSFSVTGNTIKYNSFSVDSNRMASNLQDQATLGGSVQYSRDISSRTAWNIRGTVRRIELSGGGNAVMDPNDVDLDFSDTRDQLSVSGGFSKDLESQSVSLNAGVSQIETGVLGKQNAVIFDGAWSGRLRKTGFAVAARRTQGVFTGSLATVNTTSIVAQVNRQLRVRESLGFAAEYGVSERPAQSGGDVVSQGARATYVWTGRTLTWTAGLLLAKQRSTTGFGRDQDVSNVSVALAWRFAGRGRRAT